MWSVQVTGSLSVLKPAACTAVMRAWFGVGLPQLVSLGIASKEFPRFQPGAINATACCGVRPPERPPPPETPPVPPVPVAPLAPDAPADAAPDAPANAAPDAPANAAPDAPNC